MTANSQILTIGHSNHEFIVFCRLLTAHGVTALADVRSAPYSRYTAQYNKEALDQALKAQGIKYVFLGKELGARSTDRNCYRDGVVQYRLLAETTLFKAGLERLRDGSKAYRVAIMCAEKEPLECHRTLLVARELEVGGTPVAHILADGRLEPHSSAVARLMELTGVPSEDLFRSKQELVEEAYARQERKVAYAEEQASDEEKGRTP